MGEGEIRNKNSRLDLSVVKSRCDWLGIEIHKKQCQQLMQSNGMKLVTAFVDNKCKILEDFNRLSNTDYPSEKIRILMTGLK